MDNQLQALWAPLSMGLFPTLKGDLHGKCLMMSCTVLNETKDPHEASQHKALFVTLFLVRIRISTNL